MSEDEWVWNDPQIPDDEVLYRRVPTKPSHATFDALRGRWVPHAGAFQREAREGMSVHLDGTLEARGRARHTLYDPERYGAVGFPVAVVRAANAGVLLTTPTVEEEPDEDLRAAHAEVRPPEPKKDRPFWSNVRNQMIQASVWVEQGASRSASEESVPTTRLPT